MKKFLAILYFTLSLVLYSAAQSPFKIRVENDSMFVVTNTSGGTLKLPKTAHPYYEWNSSPYQVTSKNSPSDPGLIDYHVHKIHKLTDSTARFEVAGRFQPGEIVSFTYNGFTATDVHDATTWPASLVYRVPRGTALSAITNLPATYKYVLFEKGQKYDGQMYTKAGVYYGNYGEGALPILDGRGANATVWIDRINNVTMRGIEIRNTNTNWGFQGVRARDSRNLNFYNIVVTASTNGLYLQGITKGGYVVKGGKFSGCFNAGVYIEGAPTRPQGAGNIIVAWNQFDKTSTNDPLVLHPIADEYGDLGDNIKVYANNLRESTAEELLDVVGGHFVYVDSNLFSAALRPVTVGWNATDVWIRGNWFEGKNVAANSYVSIRVKNVVVEGNWIVGTCDNQYAGNNRSAFFLYGREGGEKAEDVIIRNNIVHLLSNGKTNQSSRDPKVLQMYSQSMLPVYGNVTFSNNTILYDVANAFGPIEFENTGIYPISSSKYTANNNRYYLGTPANVYEDGATQRPLSFVQGLGKENGSQVLSPSSFPWNNQSLAGPRKYSALLLDTVILGATVVDPGPGPDPDPDPVPDPDPDPTPDPSNGCLLPSGWLSEDIGNVANRGAVCEDSGVYTISAAGRDFWDNSDEGYFVYQSLTGDGEIIAKVVNIDGADPWSKGGVMMRESSDPTAKNAFVGVTYERRWSFQRRIADNSFTFSNKSHPSTTTLPYWVRLVRVGDNFYAFRSTDGTNWTWIATETISMGETILVGLAATSRNADILNDAVFTNVSINQEPSLPTLPPCTLPANWSNGDVGNVRIEGAVCADGGRVMMTASGRDIGGAADEMHYMYQQISGDGEIIAKVTDIIFTNNLTRAGVMIRESLQTGSRSAMLGVNYENSWSFIRRLAPSAAAIETKSAAAAVSLPYWVRLVRAGNDFTAYRSTDGVNWTFVASEYIPMQATVYYGIAASSRNLTNITQVTFENVSFGLGGGNNFPVELTAFDAEAQPNRNRVALNWVTASETNNHFFTIERSLDGMLFDKLFDVPSKGNGTETRSYEAFDAQPVAGKAYYRLKQTDFDGTFTYSDRVEVTFDAASLASLRVYPNPAIAGQEIRFEFTLPGAREAVVSLVLANGQTVYEQTIEEASFGTFILPTEGLKPGMYFVKIGSKDDPAVKAGQSILIRQ